MTTSWIDERMPCGCGIRKFAPEGGYDIDYCPKHKAASDIYEALERLMTALENWGIDNAPSELAIRIAYNLAKPALAKAEGK